MGIHEITATSVEPSDSITCFRLVVQMRCFGYCFVNFLQCN